MIDNLEQMKEFNTYLITKLLNFIKKKNKSSVIEFDWFVELLNLHLMPLNSKENRKKFFKLISDNGITIKKEDLRNFYFDLNLNCTDQQINQIFNCLTLGRTEEIHFDEFDKIVEYS